MPASNIKQVKGHFPHAISCMSWTSHHVLHAINPIQPNPMNDLHIPITHSLHISSSGSRTPHQGRISRTDRMNSSYGEATGTPDYHIINQSALDDLTCVGCTAFQRLSYRTMYTVTPHNTAFPKVDGRKNQDSRKPLPASALLLNVSRGNHGSSSLVAGFTTSSATRVRTRERLSSKCWQVSRPYVSVLWQAKLLGFVRGEYICGGD